MRVVIALAAGAMCAIVSPARAAVSFVFGAGQSNYTASSTGATVQVPLYLYETRGSGDTSILTTVGLYSAGFSISRGANSSGAGVASVAQNVTTSPLFAGGDSTLSFTASSASVDENLGNSMTGALGESTGSLTSRILIGTLTLTSDTIAGVTPFSMADTGLTLRNDTGNPLSITSGSFTVTSVVPEPASLGVLGGVLLLLTRRRR